MKKDRWVSATAGAAMVAAMFALPGVGVAHASGGGNGNTLGSGNGSLLSGNSVSLPISAPVNLCGLSLAVLGFSNSGCAGGAGSVASPPGGDAGGGNGNTAGNGNASVVSGNTVSAPVTAPVDLCGVSAAGGGFADSHCHGGASTQLTGPAGGSGGNGNTLGNGNALNLSGNTISVPVNAPINVCGISLALIGFADSGCAGGATTAGSGGAPGSNGSNGNTVGNGNSSNGSGNTISVPVNVPVDVCGVTLGVAGFAGSGCQGGSVVNPPVCQGDQCNPPACQGDQCNPPACQGNDCTPPGCQGNGCTPPPGPGTPPNGPGIPPNGPGGVTTVTLPSNGLPTTGADLLLLGVAAIGSIGVGAGTIALARRRRNGTAR